MPARYISTEHLKVAEPLYDLVRDEITPGLNIEPGKIWQTLAEVVANFGRRNKALLATRDSLQAQIDAWLEKQSGPPDVAKSKAFLLGIGYLVPEPADFDITPTHVDHEIASIAGPQLIVPLDNGRYALNAINARWGSLYDALYGTDIIPEIAGAEQGRSYNPKRGELVIAKANSLLDEHLPLAAGRWQDAVQLAVQAGNFVCILTTGEATQLADTSCFIGYRQQAGLYSSFLFKHNGLHIDLLIDPKHQVGRQNAAGVKDVALEAAISTILDCEDSVAAVDAEDKTILYRHWVGIMRGNLTATFIKAGQQQTRSLNPDREYIGKDGAKLVLPGRSLLLLRHVGSHLYTKAVTTETGEAIPETFLDAVITVAGAMHDLLRTDGAGNSRTGSVYIVKPKHHGPEEVALSVEVFGYLERAFGIANNRLKIGIMDEERRTTLNLKACIRAARERVIFINTGFLDRTGDEIHTSMVAGPVLPKATIKKQAWISAYEDRNVDIGLACGFRGKAQIGKGMWPEPDAMAAMMASKIAHPTAGANCAWVPSPVAATLHALHYHQVSVLERQSRLKTRKVASIDDILMPPLLGTHKLAPDAIQQELDNNVQGILGYVVRWVEQGVGCSKVSDITDTGLMEDRATLRISSQHIANWLYHGIVNKQQILASMQRMAETVDRQNAGDSSYRPMAPDYENSLTFQSVADLIFEGRDGPNGYTEHILTRYRQAFKAKSAQ